MPRRRRSESVALTESIGQRLARIRKACGITQVELANELKVSQGNVSAYERGELRLHGDLIVKIAKILKVSADELLGLAPPSTLAPIKDRRVLRRLELIDHLPKRDKDATLRILINASMARNQEAKSAA